MPARHICLLPKSIRLAPGHAGPCVARGSLFELSARIASAESMKIGIIVIVPIGEHQVRVLAQA
jgi:hypothetical protein